jgi:protein-L-isoaspartate(D-aspartate) O-methyltransferase
VKAGTDARSLAVKNTYAILVLLLIVLLAALAPVWLPGTPKPTTVEPPNTVEPDNFAEQREELVRTGVEDWGVSDPVTLEAMRTVPRHEFVPPDYLDQAYANHPLPIGYGQTISQPYIVGLMTEALALEPDDKVLEIGTGSGYQAAILAEIVDEVYTIEIVGALADSARERLEQQGYDNVHVRHADGYYGWEEEAPFDGIIVTAAPDHVPQPLVNQLASGGRMVIPVGPVGGYQELWLLERKGDKITSTSLGGVRFVPLTRGEQ